MTVALRDVPDHHSKDPLTERGGEKKKKGFLYNVLLLSRVDADATTPLKKKKTIKGEYYRIYPYLYYVLTTLLACSTE